MGSRYGVKIRKTESKIRKLQRLDHACPRCGKKKVRRTSTAVWACPSCKAIFAGGAYFPQTGAGLTQGRMSSKSGSERKQQN